MIEKVQQKFLSICLIPHRKITTRHAGDLNVRIMSLESIRGYILEDLIEMIISIVVIIPLLMYLLYTETFYTLILMFLLLVPIYQYFLREIHI